MGGSLVSIYDESELGRITGLLDYSDYWIGLKRIGQTFVWNDGSSSAYRNWPLGKTSPGLGDGKCVTINFSEGARTMEFFALNLHHTKQDS